MIRIASWVLGAVLLATIIHILAVITLPSLATETKWRSLYDGLTPNTVRTLSTSGADDDAVTNLDPFTTIALCRYNLSEAALDIQLPELDAYWSLSLINDRKTTVFAMNDRTGGRTDQGIVAILEQDAPRYLASLAEGSTPPLVIEARDPEGIAVLRIFADTPAQADVYRGRANEYSCAPLPLEGV